ncbi:Mor transcription activator family protein [Pseudomonas aeruginosa]
MAGNTKLRSNKASELIAFIGSGFSEHLGKHVRDEATVSKATLDFMDWIRTHLGGQQVYFPRELQVDKAEQFAEIYDKHFHGTSIQDLVLEYKVSTQAIYRAIASEREKRRLERDALEQERLSRSRERWKREGGNGDAV